MHLSSRRSDDADVIRARLRLLLEEGRRSSGWLPEDDEVPGPATAPGRADQVTVPLDTGPDLPHDRREDATDDRAAATALPVGIGRHRAPGAAVRLDPGRPGAWSLWLAGLAAVSLLLVWTWWERPRVEPVGPPAADAQRSPEQAAGVQPLDDQSAAEDPRGQAVPAPSVGEAAQTSSTVVVSVVGLVARPGLVTLPSGSRAADAVAAAGGLLPEADPASVNLAAVVADGQQLAVGVPGSPPAAAPPAAGGGSGAASPVNLNVATVADLDALPGIGPVLAQRIVDHRAREGQFSSVDQLNDVAGIGPTIFAGLAELVTV